MRTCIENSFHKSNRTLPQLDEQVRRRVFWACYINDRHSSSVLGRPVALQDEDIEIEVCQPDFNMSNTASSNFLSFP
jgi:hypothetical protein